jgi:hypothetical protein
MPSEYYNNAETAFGKLFSFPGISTVSPKRLANQNTAKYREETQNFGPKIANQAKLLM